MATPLVLVLGGTRSGKSRFGLEQARQLAGERPVAYLATALPGDPELDRRIAGHRSNRPSDWPTIDVGADLAGAIRSVGDTDTILLDGLTLWLSLVGGDLADDTHVDALLDGPIAAGLDALRSREGAAVVVSDEIGLGIVPMNAGARAFRDLIGITHQRLADAADEVHLLVAGLAVLLKSR